MSHPAAVPDSRTVVIAGNKPLLILARGVGLYREKRWARPVLGLALVPLVIVSAIALVTVAPSGASGAILQAALPGLVQWVIVAWYFYGYSAVRRYYRQLDDDRAESFASAGQRQS
ncbi:MAG TPA: hypothetical protein VHG09_00710 [Longimicrobiales bacterium]|nr:hypothetical protein [Longimicrobiales bacterium]